MVDGAPTPADATVMREACRGLAALAFGDDENKACLRDGGARRALTAAIDRHPDDPRVQQMGRALLTEIAP